MFRLQKILVLLLIILLSSKSVYSQLDTLQAKTGDKVIHLDLGIIGFSASFEQTIHQWERSHLNFRMGVGYLLTLDLDEAVNVFPSLQWIIGKKYIFLEGGLGVNFIYNTNSQKFEPLPLIQAGLRFEPPDKGPVVRVGIGTESSIASVGLGWKF